VLLLPSSTNHRKTDTAKNNVTPTSARIAEQQQQRQPGASHRIAFLSSITTTQQPYLSTRRRETHAEQTQEQVCLSNHPPEARFEFLFLDRESPRTKLRFVACDNIPIGAIANRFLEFDRNQTVPQIRRDKTECSPTEPTARTSFRWRWRWRRRPSRGRRQRQHRRSAFSFFLFSLR